MVTASIPSPSTGVVHLGPLPLRGYALMIILGVLAATYLTGRRLRARGADPKLAGDAVVPAVLLGIVGARIYHVVSSPDGYFGADGNLLDALKIWEGGLAIWGAVAGGALGVWLVCRRAGVSLGLYADAAAPGIVLAQAIGRWGNWFNQELYGRPTDLPWAVEIDPEHRTAFGISRYHPTFLYESLWNIGVFGVLLLVDRKRRLGRGKLFALYVALYTAGRLWVEALRVDPAEKVFGLRVNIWVSILVFVVAVVAIIISRRPVDPDVSAQAVPGKPAADGEPAAGEEAAAEGPAEENALATVPSGAGAEAQAPSGGTAAAGVPAGKGGVVTQSGPAAAGPAPTRATAGQSAEKAPAEKAPAEKAPAEKAPAQPGPLTGPAGQAEPAGAGPAEPTADGAATSG